MKKEKRDKEIQMNLYKEQRKRDWEMKKQDENFKTPRHNDSQANLHYDVESKNTEKKCIIM